MTCIIIDDEIAAINVIKHYLKDFSELSIIGEARNGEDALILLNRLQPDLVFLDIQMPQMDGFELLQQLSSDYLPIIIFTTAYDQYALKAFEFSALDYLLKPFTKERFQAALSRAKQSIHSKTDQFRLSELKNILEHIQPAKKYLQRLPVKVKDQIQFIEANEIIWVESQGKFCKVHLLKGFKVINKGLGALEKDMDPQKFLRIHKSHMINLSQIKALSPHFHGEYNVYMKNGDKLKLSRSYKFQLEKLLYQF